MSMSALLAQMPDLWQRVLREHVSDGRGRCVACRDDSGVHGAWPCLSYVAADQARRMQTGAASSDLTSLGDTGVPSGRHSRP